MAVKFAFKDNSDQVLKMMASNAIEAVEAAGEIYVEAVQDKILYGYSDPHGSDGHTEIVDTGALFDSITADVKRVSQNAFEVGVGVPAGTRPAEYAKYVHDGTYKLKGRPFITDGITDAAPKAQEAIADALKQGF